MSQVVIVFTLDANGYYIEEVFNTLDEANDAHEISLVLNGDEWTEFRDEISNPTIEENCQMAVIHKVTTK